MYSGGIPNRKVTYNLGAFSQGVWETQVRKVRKSNYYCETFKKFSNSIPPSTLWTFYTHVTPNLIKSCYDLENTKPFEEWGDLNPTVKNILICLPSSSLVGKVDLHIFLFVCIKQILEFHKLLVMFIIQ